MNSISSVFKNISINLILIIFENVSNTEDRKFYHGKKEV